MCRGHQCLSGPLPVTRRTATNVAGLRSLLTRTGAMTDTAMTVAPSPAEPHEGCMSGFGNQFESEALAGALPRGMTAP